MSGGGVDIWIQSFAPGTDAVAALQRVFGIDEARANAICQTIPRAVRRNAPPRDAEEIAAALRKIGAKVELRPHKGDARGSAPSAPRPAPRASSPEQPRPDVSSALPMPLDARGSGPGLPAPTRTARSSGPGLPVPSFDAAAPEPVKKPSASLDPFDASSSGGALELAFDPDAERARAPKPTPRAGIDRRSLPEIAPPEAAAPPAPQTSSGWSMPSLSFGLPGWVRGLGCFSGLSLLFFVLRVGRCAWAFSGAVVPPSPAEIEAMQAENEAAMLAGAVPVEAFLARPAAMLGRDVDRNRGFATRLRTLGATRVLVADIARVSGGDLGLTLVVELPDNVAARRQIATEIERYYANGMPVEAGDVAVPEPGERYEVVDLE